MLWLCSSQSLQISLHKHQIHYSVYMITTAFAEIVGLLCHYRQEKGDREALDHQKFIEWLEYHRHEEIKNLIVNPLPYKRK